MGPQMMPAMGQKMMYPRMGPAMTLPMGQGMVHPNGTPAFNAMGQPLTPWGQPISPQMFQQIMMAQVTQSMNKSVGQPMGQTMGQPMGQPKSDEYSGMMEDDPSMVKYSTVRNHGN
jgi:hypothetical protein